MLYNINDESEGPAHYSIHDNLTDEEVLKIVNDPNQGSLYTPFPGEKESAFQKWHREWNEAGCPSIDEILERRKTDPIYLLRGED